MSEVARVVIVEDGGSSSAIAVLKAEGFGVVTALLSEDAIDEIERVAAHLVLFEVHGSGFAGRELCRRIRSRSPRPIAVMSADASEREVLDWFEAGVDAFLASPVGPHELVARVRALLRYTPRQIEPDRRDSLTIGHVTLDRSARQIFVGGRRVVMPRREFDIAEILMTRAGMVVPREELVRSLWISAPGSKMLNVNSKSLDVQVGRLRGRLQSAGGRPVIATVRGVGYRFLAASDQEIDLTQADAAAASSV